MKLSSSNLSTHLSRVSRHSKLWVILLLCLACGAIAIFHLTTLTKFPSVLIDEPWIANAAWNWLTAGENFDSMHAESRQDVIWPQIGHLPLRLSFAAFGLGLFQARIVSWVSGVLLVVFTVLAGYKSYGIVSGLLAALLLSLSYTFLLSSHLVRPDIMLSMVAVLCFFLSLVAFNDNKWWAHLLTGIIISLSLDIHWNALMLGMGFTSLYLYHYRMRVFKNPGTWFFLSGLLIGLLYYLLAIVIPDPGKFMGYLRFSSDISHPVPVLSFDPMVLLRSARDEIRRYGLYQNSLEYLFIFAGMVFVAIRRSKIDQVFLVFITSVFISFVLFTGNKSVIYVILLYPYLALTAAEAIRSAYQAASTANASRVFIATVFLFFLISSTINLSRSATSLQNYNYDTTTQKIREKIPPGSRVIGLPIWWLGLHDYDFHSLESLSYYHFSRGYSLTDGLEEIRPDYLIVDKDVEIHLSDDNYFGGTIYNMYKFPVREFMKFLDLRGTKVLEFSDPGHGRVAIYQIHWDN